MAIVKAISAGNWSNPAIWSSGSVPGINDDVYLNNYNITINQDIDVLSINNIAGSGIVAGGYIQTNNPSVNYTILCDSITSTSAYFYLHQSNYDVTFGSSSRYITLTTTTLSGTFYFYSGINNIIVYANTTIQSGLFFNNGVITGKMFHYGDLLLQGGTAYSSLGQITKQTGSLNLVSGILASSGAGSVINIIHDLVMNSCYFGNSTAGTINIIGNFNSGTGSIPPSVYSNLVVSGVVNITGNVTITNSISSTYGYWLLSGGKINIIGNITGGSTPIAQPYTTTISEFNIIGNVYPTTSTWSTIKNFTGQFAAAGAKCTITGDVYGNPTIDISTIESDSFTSLVILKGRMINQSDRQAISAKRLRVGNTGNVSMSIYKETLNEVRTLATDGASNLPSTSDVRHGITYGSSFEYTGTCRVPNPDNVQKGVLVDNTTGTTILTISDYQEGIANILGNIIIGLEN